MDDVLAYAGMSAAVVRASRCALKNASDGL